MLDVNRSSASASVVLPSVVLPYLWWMQQINLSYLQLKTYLISNSLISRLTLVTTPVMDLPQGTQFGLNWSVKISPKQCFCHDNYNWLELFCDSKICWFSGIGVRGARLIPQMRLQPHLRDAVMLSSISLSYKFGTDHETTIMMYGW